MSAHISTLKGIGPALAAKFAVLGIHSVHDLLGYLPRRYEDYSDVQKIKDLPKDFISEWTRFHSF